MCWIGAASLTRKETALRRCMSRLARAWASRTGPPSPPRVAAQNGMRPSRWTRVSCSNCGWPSDNSSGRGTKGTPFEKKGNPCSDVIVESYLTFVTEEQKRVGVPGKQAAPTLVHTVAQLPQDTRVVRAQLVASVSDRIAITT